MAGPSNYVRIDNAIYSNEKLLEVRDDLTERLQHSTSSSSVNPTLAIRTAYCRCGQSRAYEGSCLDVTTYSTR